MEAIKAITNFMYYMYNRFNLDESKAVFGNNLGEHLFYKWVDLGRDDMKFFCYLDRENRELLVNRAMDTYEK